MLLLSATPWSESPGQEEALARVMAEHPWFSQLQHFFGEASIYLNVALLCGAIALRHKFFRSRLPPPPWKFHEALQLLSIYAIVFFGFYILSAAVRQEFGAFLARHGFGEMHLVMMNLATTQLIVLFLIYRFSGNIQQHAGVRLSHYWRGGDLRRAALGIPLFVAVIAPVLWLLTLSAWLFKGLGLEFDSQPLVMKLWQTESVWFVVLISIFAVTVAPVVEEILFRGILYPTIRSRWGVLPAILLNSFLFAFFHFHAPTFLPLMGLAICFSVAFELTGSLPACMLAHSLFNASSIVLIWLLRTSVPATG